MPKKGMKRPQVTHTKERDPAIVPEIQGKAKSGKTNANPIIAGTTPPNQKVYHGGSNSKNENRMHDEAYPDIYTELARDNLNNDLNFADLQDDL